LGKTRWVGAYSSDKGRRGERGGFATKTARGGGCKTKPEEVSLSKWARLTISSYGILWLGGGQVHGRKNWFGNLQGHIELAKKQGGNQGLEGLML